jgi:hypothetical protein
MYSAFTLFGQEMFSGQPQRQVASSLTKPETANIDICLRDFLKNNYVAIRT